MTLRKIGKVNLWWPIFWLESTKRFKFSSEDAVHLPCSWRMQREWRCLRWFRIWRCSCKEPLTHSDALVEACNSDLLLTFNFYNNFLSQYLLYDTLIFWRQQMLAGPKSPQISLTEEIGWRVTWVLKTRLIEKNTHLFCWCQIFANCKRIPKMSYNWDLKASKVRTFFSLFLMRKTTFQWSKVVSEAIFPTN